jgi:DNA topoisomerase-1
MFTVSASRLIFEGFQKVYMEDEEEKTPSISKAIDENTGVTLESFDPRQHYTQPLPHYTEATLVRALEEQGIGRPSTYAPTITTFWPAATLSRKKKIST